MKLFIAVVSVLFVGLVAGQEDACYKTAENACKPDSLMTDIAACNAKFGGILDIEPSLQSYANDQLAASYDYLLMATFFNSYQKDRPGFVKLYRSLSDKAFENSIKLIKQVTRRGGVADFRFHQETKQSVTEKKTLELDELHSIAKALDMEKKLSKKAMAMHGHLSKHPADTKRYDPEMTQFIEEEFLSDQTKTVRSLSGYGNDLWKIMNGNSSSLGVYLFDQYLQKQ